MSLIAVEDDDTGRIIYEPPSDWHRKSHDGHNLTSTRKSGANATFKFNGTSVYVIGAISAQNPGKSFHANFSLDGRSPKNVSRTSGRTPQYDITLFSAQGLSHEPHRLVITYSSAGEVDLQIDKIQYVGVPVVSKPSTFGTTFPPYFVFTVITVGSIIVSMLLCGLLWFLINRRQSRCNNEAYYGAVLQSEEETDDVDTWKLDKTASGRRERQSSLDGLYETLPITDKASAPTATIPRRPARYNLRAETTYTGLPPPVTVLGHKHHPNARQQQQRPRNHIPSAPLLNVPAPGTQAASQCGSSSMAVTAPRQHIRPFRGLTSHGNSERGVVPAGVHMPRIFHTPRTSESPLSRLSIILAEAFTSASESERKAGGELGATIYANTCRYHGRISRPWTTFKFPWVVTMPIGVAVCTACPYQPPPSPRCGRLTMYQPS